MNTRPGVLFRLICVRFKKKKKRWDKITAIETRS